MNLLMKGGAPVQPNSNYSTIFTKIPNQEQPLIVKLVPDIRAGNLQYRPLELYRFMVGADPSKHTRDYPSQKFWGLDSPEDAVYWELMKQRKQRKLELQTDSAIKSDPLCNKLTEAIKRLTPMRRGVIYIVKQDDPKIYPVIAPEQLLQQLFGAPKTATSPATPGIIAQMMQAGRNPFDLTKEYGWLCIYKTGMGLETKYYVKEHSVDKVVEGQVVPWPFSKAVHPFLLSDQFSLDHFPDIVPEMESKRWSYEESVAFAQNLGDSAFVPARLLNKTPSVSSNPLISVAVPQPVVAQVVTPQPVVAAPVVAAPVVAATIAPQPVAVPQIMTPAVAPVQAPIMTPAVAPVQAPIMAPIVSAPVSQSNNDTLDDLF